MIIIKDKGQRIKEKVLSIENFFYTLLIINSKIESALNQLNPCKSVCY